MTPHELRQFYERRFCACGKKATRIAKGVVWCERHAPPDDYVAPSTETALNDFRVHRGTAVRRTYRHLDRGPFDPKTLMT